MSTTCSRWLDLHPDIFHEIVRRLDFASIACFSSVCRSWRSYYRTIHRHCRCHQCLDNSQIPWLQLPWSPDLHRVRFYSLVEDRVYDIHLPQLSGHHVITSSNGFLISADEIAADLHATNPLTGFHVSLPPTSTFPNITATNYDSSGQIASYTIGSSKFPKTSVDLDPSGAVGQRENDLSRTLDLRSMRRYFKGAFVILISPNTIAVVVACAKLGHDVPECLAVARAGDCAWTSLHSPVNYHYADIVFHSGLLHCINPSGIHATFDLDHPTHPPTLVPIVDDCCESEFLDVLVRRHLVASPDDEGLFSVAWRYSTRGTLRAVVFEHLTDESRWREVQRLKDDAAMFTSRDRSWMAIPAATAAAAAREEGLQFPPPVIATNCIYFPENFNGAGGIGVFNLGDGNIKQLNLGPHLSSWHKFPASSPALWFKPTFMF